MPSPFSRDRELKGRFRRPRSLSCARRPVTSSCSGSCASASTQPPRATLPPTSGRSRSAARTPPLRSTPRPRARSRLLFSKSVALTPFSLPPSFSPPKGLLSSPEGCACPSGRTCALNGNVARLRDRHRARRHARPRRFDHLRRARLRRLQARHALSESWRLSAAPPRIHLARLLRAGGACRRRPCTPPSSTSEGAFYGVALNLSRSQIPDGGAVIGISEANNRWV